MYPLSLLSFVLQNEPRYYKEEFCNTKKVTQTKTSYNFLNEHSDDIPHNIKPNKAIARMTDSNIGLKAKYEDQEVIYHVILNTNRQLYLDPLKRKIIREINSSNLKLMISQ